MKNYVVFFIYHILKQLPLKVVKLVLLNILSMKYFGLGKLELLTTELWHVISFKIHIIINE